MNRPALPVTLIAGAAMGVATLAGCGGSPAATPPPSASPSTQAAPTTATSPSQPASPSAPAGTQIITYAPWAGADTLASGIAASATQSGSCYADSSATTASGAYRCLVGNILHDPCFEDATTGAGEVACPSTANPDSVVVIKLTGALPTPATASAPYPWLLVLANGQHCSTDTGTVPTLGGKNEYYLCLDGGGGYGQPDESGSTWTITYAPAGAAASAMASVAVTQAYE